MRARAAALATCWRWQSWPRSTVEVTGTIAKPAAAGPPTQDAAPLQPAKDSGDGGGVPIWAGIGLMLMAAVAGSAAARARNRRRMRDYMSDE